MMSFSMTLNDANPDFKDTPLFDVEYPRYDRRDGACHFRNFSLKINVYPPFRSLIKSRRSNKSL